MEPQCKNSDKNALLESCQSGQDLHIVGIAETHLVNDSVINVDNYEWFGNNRKHIHIRTKAGSGGVGILVKKDVLSTFKVTIEDNSEDRILWIRFTEIGKSYNCFYVCVVYLPPAARSVNAHNFFDVLMEQIYTIPNGFFFICVAISTVELVIWMTSSQE
jgi:exonuclease III